MGSYFDNEGIIRKELLDEEARQVANDLVVTRFNSRSNKEELSERDSVKNSQLRRFYGEFKALERKLDQVRGDREENFRRILPMVKMARAKVEYAKARNVVTQAFVNWLGRNIGDIHSVKDFEAFMLHFEAVVGYCYARNPKD